MVFVWAWGASVEGAAVVESRARPVIRVYVLSGSENHGAMAGAVVV